MSSSSTPRPRGQAAQTSVTSPLAQAPTFSPPAHALPASPLRRSFNSDANTDSSSNHRHSGSTIRIVNDPGNDVYDKFPLPSEPSQILPPPRNAPGYAFETPAARVSSGSRVANAIARFESARSPPAQPPLQRQKGSVRHSLATNASEDDTLVGTSLSRSSLRYSQNSTPRSSLPPPEFQDFETDLDVLEEESSSLTLPSTIRAVPPSSSGGDTIQSTTHALSSQASDASLATASPTGSPAQYVHVDRDTSRISRPISKVPNYTFASELEGGPSAFSGSFSHRPPVLQPSTESFAYSNISSTSIEPEEPSPTPSPPTHAGSRLTYSSARSPSDYSLADSQNAPTYVSRMLDRGLAHTWSSQLSTIASVSERDSRSYGHSTPLFGARSRSQSHSTDSYGGQERIQTTRRRGQTVGSTYSSDNRSTNPSESALPLPLFSPGQSPQQDLFDEKHEDEDLDKISPLPSSVPLRMKNSGYLRRQSSDISLNSSRPNSSHSDISTFNRSIIPAWARAYYKRGERISMSPGESESSAGSIRLGSSHSGRSHTPSERHFPGGVHRPRNRPGRASYADTMSMSQSNEHLIDEDGYMVGANGYPLSGYSTPHLRRDRREHPRYSFWGAPSLDSDFGQRPLSQHNRQIFLFSLGFIFPLAWMIASCLPLPFDPSLAPSQSQVDLEQGQFAQRVAALDDKAFQKANWWRNLNRVMSGVGTLLIGVIIALAILASKMA